MKRSIAALSLLVVGCGTSSGPSNNPLKNVSALAFLERAPSHGMGDVFQYLPAYSPGSRILKLQPPTADGDLTTLCCEQFAGFEAIDIQSYDVSFDGKSLVFSGRLSASERYGLFLLTLDDDGNATEPPEAIATNPQYDYVFAFFKADNEIGFMTNNVIEQGVRQHQDEYERGVTSQLGSIGVDGSNELLGPTNLSHRTTPSVMENGNVMFSEWTHLGDENSGKLRMINPDYTSVRELFGSEDRGATNSYLRPASAGPTRVVTIATARSGTLQAGKIIMAELGETVDGVFLQSEAHSSFVDLTPLVPGGEDPSLATVGRYYDAYPVRNEAGEYGERPLLVVSWSDGPVTDDLSDDVDFGIYLYDSARSVRQPIYNDPEKWEILAKPLQARTAPPVAEPAVLMGDSLLIGSLDVYRSSIVDLPEGEAQRVRILEGFSVEEGIPDDFGLTEHEGAALIGEAPVYADGSWAAYVPANVPIHLQVVDKFGIAIGNEPVWFSGRAGESRFCGGCHEDRAVGTVVEPGVTDAVVQGAELFDRPRAERQSLDFSFGNVRGVPWDLALQPIFDAKCVSCHDGTPGAANPSYTMQDTETGEQFTFAFNLDGAAATYGVGEQALSAYTNSHLSLLGPMMMELEEGRFELVEGEIPPAYVQPASARDSILVQKLNPPQRYPEVDTSVRLDPDAPVHPLEVPGFDGEELTPDEYYLIILMADAGGQFYSRENAPGGSGYGGKRNGGR